MEPDVLQKIRSVNLKFYQTFADSFAETRGRLQPGVNRLLPNLLEAERILDLGCGNGELASTLAANSFSGKYVGVDISARMLAIARDSLVGQKNIIFLEAGIGLDDLGPVIQANTEQRFHPPYDHLIAFATLHHIPGQVTREALMRELHNLAVESSIFTLSVWNFMDSQRLRERILPWETIGLDEEQVEPGDYLMDWRRDGQGVRYVHHFSEHELSALAEQAGFQVEETFYSDGETGTLGLYQIWRA